MKTASELFRCVENGEIKLLRVAAIALAFLPNGLADIAPVRATGTRPHAAVVREGE